MLIDSIPCTSIKDLVDLIGRETVRPRVASNAEQIALWEENAAALHFYGKQVTPLAEEHFDLVRNALQEWKNRRDRFLRLFDGSGTAFAFWLQSLQDDFLSNSVSLDAIATDSLVSNATNLAKRVVGNIDWCTTFGYYLPRAAPGFRAPATNSGIEMLSIFWLEELGNIFQRPHNTCGTHNRSKIYQLLQGCIENSRQGHLYFED